MLWILKSIILGELILGALFALCLLLDWLCGEVEKWSIDHL